MIKPCFLEMAEPSINAAIDELVEQKIKHIYVFEMIEVESPKDS